MFIVTIDLDAYEQLPPRQLRAMLRSLRFADPDGLVRASLTMLAMPGLSRSAVHRDLGALEDDGHIKRQEEGGYRIARRYRPSIVPAAGTPAVPQVGTPNSRPPAFSKPSSELRSSERELSLQDEIPDGWIAAATTARRRVDLPDVDLQVEWRKLVIYAADERISRSRWLMWSMRARLDHTNTPAPVTGDTTTVVNPETLPNAAPPAGTDQERARARGWAKTGRWAPQGVDWGPAPDRPDCALPPGLIAWCCAARLAAT